MGQFFEDQDFLLIRKGVRFANIKVNRHLGRNLVYMLPSCPAAANGLKL